MNGQHRAIRAMLGRMAPRRAIAWIKSQELPEEEEQCLILCDVRKKSHVQAGDMLHLSPEAVKRKRRAAFGKLADAMTKS